MPARAPRVVALRRAGSRTAPGGGLPPDGAGRRARLDPVDSTWSTSKAARSAGLDVVRRRSGGGAVLVTPGRPGVDRRVGAGRRRTWSADVTGAFVWLGAAWGPPSAYSARHRGRCRRRDDGRRRRPEVTHPTDRRCRGPGSRSGCLHPVVVPRLLRWRRRRRGHCRRPQGGRTVPAPQPVGAWFHSACVRHWDPALLLELLDLSPGERAAAADGLAVAVSGVDDELRARGRRSIDRWTAWWPPCSPRWTSGRPGAIPDVLCHLSPSGCSRRSRSPVHIAPPRPPRPGTRWPRLLPDAEGRLARAGPRVVRRPAEPGIGVPARLAVRALAARPGPWAALATREFLSRSWCQMVDEWR